MSVIRPSIVAVAGGKFQRAHGMSFCGGSANVVAVSGVTGFSAANAAALGGAPPGVAALAGTDVAAARTPSASAICVRFTCSPRSFPAAIDHDRPHENTKHHG